jgi:hypothetical protein
MEFDLFAFLVGAVLGAFVGYRLCDHIHKAIIPDLMNRVGVTPEKLEQVMKDLQKEIAREEDSTTAPEINIKVEAVNNQLYVYRKDTNEFLAQGKNYEELLKILQSKFQNVKFAVAKEDGADLLGLGNNPTA